MPDNNEPQEFELVEIDELDFDLEIPKGMGEDELTSLLYREFPDKFPQFEPAAMSYEFNISPEAMQAQGIAAEKKASGLSTAPPDTAFAGSATRPTAPGLDFSPDGHLPEPTPERIAQNRQIMEADAAKEEAEAQERAAEIEELDNSIVLNSLALQNLQNNGLSTSDEAKVLKRKIEFAKRQERLTYLAKIQTETRQKEIRQQEWSDRLAAAGVGEITHLEIAMMDVMGRLHDSRTKQAELDRAQEAQAELDLYSLTPAQVEEFHKGGMMTLPSEGLIEQSNHFMEEPYTATAQANAQAVFGLDINAGIQKAGVGFVEKLQSQASPIERYIAENAYGPSGDEPLLAQIPGVVAQAIYQGTNYFGLFDSVTVPQYDVNGELTSVGQFRQPNFFDATFNSRPERGLVGLIVMGEDNPEPYEPVGMIERGLSTLGGMAEVIPEFIGGGAFFGPYGKAAQMAGGFMAAESLAEIYRAFMIESGEYINNDAKLRSFLSKLSKDTTIAGINGVIFRGASSTVSRGLSASTQMSFLTEKAIERGATKTAKRAIGAASVGSGVVATQIATEFFHEGELSYSVRSLEDAFVFAALGAALPHGGLTGRAKSDRTKPDRAKSDRKTPDVPEAEMTIIQKLQRDLDLAATKEQADAIMARALEESGTDALGFVEMIIRESPNISINEFPSVSLKQSELVPRIYRPNETGLDPMPRSNEIVGGFSERVITPDQGNPVFITREGGMFKVGLSLVDGTEFMLSKTFNNRPAAQAFRRATLDTLANDRERSARLDQEMQDLIDQGVPTEFIGKEGNGGLTELTRYNEESTRVANERQAAEAAQRLKINKERKLKADRRKVAQANDLEVQRLTESDKLVDAVMAEFLTDPLTVEQIIVGDVVRGTSVEAGRIPRKSAKAIQKEKDAKEIEEVVKILGELDTEVTQQLVKIGEAAEPVKPKGRTKRKSKAQRDVEKKAVREEPLAEDAATPESMAPTAAQQVMRRKARELAGDIESIGLGNVVQQQLQILKSSKLGKVAGQLDVGADTVIDTIIHTLREGRESELANKIEKDRGVKKGIGALRDNGGMALRMVPKIQRAMKELLDRMRALEKDDPKGNQFYIDKAKEKMVALSKLSQITSRAAVEGEFKPIDYDADIKDMSFVEKKQLAKSLGLKVKGKSGKDIVDEILDIRNEGVNRILGDENLTPFEVEVSLEQFFAENRSKGTRLKEKSARETEAVKEQWLKGLFLGDGYLAEGELLKAARRKGDDAAVRTLINRDMERNMSQAAKIDLANTVLKLKENLRPNEFEVLENVIYLRRNIAILLARPEINTDPRATLAKLQIGLDGIRRRVGDETFEILMEKSDIAFDFFKRQLVSNRNAQLITAKEFEDLNENLYTPAEVIDKMGPIEFARGERILGPTVRRRGTGPEKGETRNEYMDLVDTMVQTAKKSDNRRAANRSGLALKEFLEGPNKPEGWRMAKKESVGEKKTDVVYEKPEAGEAYIDVRVDGVLEKMIVDKRFAESWEGIKRLPDENFLKDMFKLLSLSPVVKAAGAGWLRPFFFTINAPQELHFSASAPSILGSRTEGTIRVPFGRRKKDEFGRPIPRSQPSIRLGSVSMSESRTRPVHYKLNPSPAERLLEPFRYPVALSRAFANQVRTFAGSVRPTKSGVSRLYLDYIEGVGEQKLIGGGDLLPGVGMEIVPQRMGIGIGPEGSTLHRITSNNKYLRTLRRRATGAYDVKMSNPISAKWLPRASMYLNNAFELNARAGRMLEAMTVMSKNRGVSLDTLIEKFPEDVQIAAYEAASSIRFGTGNQAMSYIEALGPFTGAYAQVMRGSGRAFLDNPLQAAIDLSLYTLLAMYAYDELTDPESNTQFDGVSDSVLSRSIPIFNIPNVGPISYIDKPTGQEKDVYIPIPLDPFQAVAWNGVHAIMSGATGKTAARPLAMVDAVASLGRVGHNPTPAALQAWAIYTSRNRRGSSSETFPGSQYVTGSAVRDSYTNAAAVKLSEHLPEGMLRPKDATEAMKAVPQALPFQVIGFFLNETLNGLPPSTMRRSYWELVSTTALIGSQSSDALLARKGFKAEQEVATGDRVHENVIDNEIKRFTNLTGGLNFVQDGKKIDGLFGELAGTLSEYVVDNAHEPRVGEMVKRKLRQTAEVVSLKNTLKGHQDVFLRLIGRSGRVAGLQAATYLHQLETFGIQQEVDDFLFGFEEVLDLRDKSTEWGRDFSDSFDAKTKQLKTDKEVRGQTEGLLNWATERFLDLLGKNDADAAELTPAERQHNTLISGMADQLSAEGREGFRRKAYPDPVFLDDPEKITVGYGQLVSELINRGDLPADTDPLTYELPPGPEGKALARRWLVKSINIAADDIKSLVPKFDTFDDNRRQALVEFSYVFGKTKMKGFPDMLAALNTSKGSFKKAALDMVLADTKSGDEPSDWWNQDRPRAVFVARKLLTNQPLRIVDVRRDLAAHPDRSPRQDLGL